MTAILVLNVALMLLGVVLFWLFWIVLIGGLLMWACREDWNSEGTGA